MSQNQKQIMQFAESKVKQLLKLTLETTEPMQELKNAVKTVSYAQILSQFLGNNQYLYESLMTLSKVYLKNECFGQAMINARMARKQANPENGQKEKASFLIADCMAKQNKYEDAYEILMQFKIQNNFQENQQKYYELLLNVLLNLKDEQKTYETLENLDRIVRDTYGQKSIQFGLNLVQKGKSLGNFGKYQEAIAKLNEGIDILIEKKCKSKRKVYEVYLILAEYYKKTNQLEKQYSSLVCAHSMSKQLDQPHKQMITTLHLLANNLIERQEYHKAVKELKKAESLEKQNYGESSAQFSRTVKKIVEVLDKMGLKSEIKKYQMQYSRVVSANTLKQKSINISGTICA